MKKIILMALFSIPVTSTAADFYCRSHTYGDNIYEISVDIKKKTAEVIGTDRWYRTDFIKAKIKDIEINKKSDEMTIINGKDLHFVIRPYAKEYFGSPAIFRGMKLDFDCRDL